jgi:hypothetical protein
MNCTRRHFGKIALAVLPASTVMAKPNSRWDGVQVGINVPFSFKGMSGTADMMLEYMNQIGLSAVELRLQPVEAKLGAPGVYASRFDMPGRATGGPGQGRVPGNFPERILGSGSGTGASPGGQARRVLAPEQQEAAKRLQEWRLSLPMEKVQAFRKMYEDAGVLIQILKIDNFNSFSDEVTDYFFVVAKNLGCNALSTDGNLADVERLGRFADKHQMMIGYHGHTAGPGGEAFGAPDNWEKAMALSKYNAINLDLGHFLIGQRISPIPFLTKYHEHVTHVHVKDLKYDGTTVPFGQGDVPIVEVLQLMKKNNWKFQATIEYEYPTPSGSDTLTELTKCVDYCHKALS